MTAPDLRRICPSCGDDLHWIDDAWICLECGDEWPADLTCPICGADGPCGFTDTGEPLICALSDIETSHD